MLLTACSVTKNIPEGEMLYTGIKDLKIDIPKNIKLSGEQSYNLTLPIFIAPNNSLYTPYIRSPFPWGLWFYNIKTDKKSGIKYWLKNKMGKKPRLISDIKPALRLKMIEAIMKDYGFWNLETSYKIVPQKNKKKAKISYYIKLPQPASYSRIELWKLPDDIKVIIHNYLKKSPIKKGAKYDINVLQSEREKMSEIIRNNGYYFFRPSYIKYEADTVYTPGKVDLRISLSSQISSENLHKYSIGKVEINLLSRQPQDLSTIDTINKNDIKIIYKKPERLKPRVLYSILKLKPGDLFSVDNQNKTKSEFISLGVFSYASLSIEALDTLNHSLKVSISGKLAEDYETKIEVNFASKSNNLLGPGINYSIINKNVFKRAHKLSLELKGAYEWQVGGTKTHDDKGKVLNSYELGVNFSYTVPRLLIPKFIKFKRINKGSTKLSTSMDLVKRFNYFKMINLTTKFSYEFNSSKRVRHTIVPFELSYVDVMNTSASFDSAMIANPIIAKSFRDLFIPSVEYIYLYNRPATYLNNNRILFRASVKESGNLMSSLMYINGNTNKTNKKLFGNIFSQFVKLTSELVIDKRIDRNNELVFRFFGGLGYSYGNINVMPYSEQFYSGGANSIRGFQIRSVGPGSYYLNDKTSSSYLDQTGDIKIESNLEYRFRLLENMYGAIFTDAGNVWLLREDENRHGGKLDLKNLWDEIALGTGLGIRYDLTYLILRLDLGVALHNPYNNSRSGYFNVTNYGFNDGLVLNLAIGYPF